MSRVYRGHYRVVVKFDWPNEPAAGYDWLPPMPYEDAERELFDIAHSLKWEAVDDKGVKHIVRVKSAQIVGPLAHTIDIPLEELYDYGYTPHVW